MDYQATADPPCGRQLTFADIQALLRHINESNATISPTESSSSTSGISFVVVIVVGIIVVIVNLASLLAISQVKKISAYLRLVISLSISDILIGVRVLFESMDAQPLLGSDLEWCIFIHLRGIKMTSHLISLFNLLGLGLDHYCAIVSPLKHRSRMSASRTNAMILMFWTVSALCGFSDFFIPAPSYEYCSTPIFGNETNSSSCGSDTFYDLLLVHANVTTDQDRYVSSNYSYDFSEYYTVEQKSEENPDSITWANDEEVTLADFYALPSEASNLTEGGFCYSVMCSRYDPEYLVFTVVALLLLVMSFIYTRVCVKIYSMRHLPRGRSKRTFRRNKRGLITTMCIVGTFMICWLPFSIFTTMTLINMSLYHTLTEEYYGVSVKLDSYLYALLLLNCLCDPVIYALRMREVKIGYRRLLGRCFKGFKNKSKSTDACSSSYQMTSQYSTRVVHTNELSSRSSITGSNRRSPPQQNEYHPILEKYKDNSVNDVDGKTQRTPELHHCVVNADQVNHLGFDNNFNVDSVVL